MRVRKILTLREVALCDALGRPHAPITRVVGMGVVAKTVPQINIIQMGFALRIGAGVACMMALLPVIPSHLRHVFLVLQHELFRVLSFM